MYQRYFFHTCTQNGCLFDNFLVHIKAAKPLPPIEKGEIIRVWDKGIWNKARVEDIAGTPKSYIITEENGAHIVPRLKFAGAPFKTPERRDGQKCTTGENFSL